MEWVRLARLAGAVWTGDPDDDQTCAVAGYACHVEALDRNAWHAMVVDPAGRCVWHAAEEDVLPLTGDAARRLCELVVRAELGRAGHG